MNLPKESFSKKIKESLVIEFMSISFSLFHSKSYGKNHNDSLDIAKVGLAPTHP
jgi:hypothetical protein